MTQVIVGMDESGGAANALRWAVSEAAGRDWDIRAVLAREPLGRHHRAAAPTPTSASDPGDADVARKTWARDEGPGLKVPDGRGGWQLPGRP